MSTLASRIQEIMASNNLCVLSTVDSEGKPESALVGFSSDEKFGLLIGTSTSARKYKNLQIEPTVSVVIGFGQNKQTVQYEGIAKEVNTLSIPDRLEKHIAKIPTAQKYADNPDQRWFIVSPTWIRLVTSSPSSEEVFHP